MKNRFQESCRVRKMRKPLWVPSEERIKQANVTWFISFVNEKHGLEINSYDELCKWSIENIRDFWAAVWEFGEIKASRKYDVVVDDLSKFPGARWFIGARCARSMVQRCPRSRTKNHRESEASYTRAL